MSTVHDITPLAESDLLGIWNYTADTWGVEQANRYLRDFDACFSAITAGTIMAKRPLPGRPRLQSMRCQHHYVFFLTAKQSGKPIIIAILHENMDLIARLKERLGA
jgi:toxin ParE1/3/4